MLKYSISKKCALADDSADDLFNNSNDEGSDEEDESEGGEKKKKVKRYFVAMGKRSMVELQLTIKRHTQTPVSSTESSDKEPSPALHADTEQQRVQHQSVLGPGLLQMVSPPAVISNLDSVNQKLNTILTRLDKIEIERKESNDQLVQQIVGGLGE